MTEKERQKSRERKRETTHHKSGVHQGRVKTQRKQVNKQSSSTGTRDRSKPSSLSVSGSEYVYTQPHVDWVSLSHRNRITRTEIPIQINGSVTGGPAVFVCFVFPDWDRSSVQSCFALTGENSISLVPVEGLVFLWVSC